MYIIYINYNNSRKIFLGNAYIPYPNVNVLPELEESLDRVRYAAKPDDANAAHNALPTCNNKSLNLVITDGLSVDM